MESSSVAGKGGGGGGKDTDAETSRPSGGGIFFGVTTEPEAMRPGMAPYADALGRTASAASVASALPSCCAAICGQERHLLLLNKCIWKARQPQETTVQAVDMTTEIDRSVRWE